MKQIKVDKRDMKWIGVILRTFSIEPFQSNHVQEISREIIKRYDL